MLNQKPILVAEGDSWFDLPNSTNQADDVLEGLRGMGYKVRSVAKHGDTLKDMAYAPKQHKALHKKLRKLNSKPKAVLLSGGGNDLTKKLKKMLNSRTSALPTDVNSALDTDEVQKMIFCYLRTYYSQLIEVIRGACLEYWPQSDIPIIVHGYGHPVPDGRKFWTKGPWLYPVFRKKGYNIKKSHNDLWFATRVMEVLIDKFNEMLQLLAVNYDYVRYVDVRDLLSNSPGHYKNFWDDELHPNEWVFKCIANRIRNTL